MQPPKPNSGYRGLDRRIWAIAGIRAANTMGLSLTMAFMGVYLTKHRGFAAATYGAIYLVANLGQAIAHTLAGNISDRAGRTKVMTLALASRAGVICGIGGLVLIDAPLAILAIVLAVSSTLRGAFEPVAYALVADLSRAGQRIAAFGLQRMGTNLGWSIGPALGGGLTAIMPYGAVFFLTAGVLLLSAGITARLSESRTMSSETPDASTKETPAPSTPWFRIRFALLLTCSFLGAFAHVQLFSTLSIFTGKGLDFSEAQIGIGYLVNGACVLSLQVPAVAIINRIGSTRALVIGALVYGTALLSFAMIASVADLCLSIVVLTVGEVLVAPAHQAMTARLSRDNAMGRAFGLVGTAQMLGVAVGPLIGGALFDTWHAQPWKLWSIPAGAAALLALGYAILGGYNRAAARRVRSSEQH